MQRCNYLLTWVCCIALFSLWSCNKNNDDPIDTNPDDTTAVAENELTFKIVGGPDAVDGKTVFFTNFFSDETHAGVVDSINATVLEGVALWNEMPAYLKILLQLLPRHFLYQHQNYRVWRHWRTHTWHYQC